MLPDAVARIKNELSKLQCELESLNQNIASVDSQILYTEKEVVDLEQQLRALWNSADSTVQVVALETDLAAKRKKEELLRSEKAQLRTEKAQLRTAMRQEKEQLRAMEVFPLKIHQGRCISMIFNLLPWKNKRCSFVDSA
jgi:predicted  nucleic acid-binding Zn-ribbon protein